MAQDRPSPPSPAFPKVLRLPAIERPVRVPVADPGQVRSAAGLPERLLLGDLVPESFQTRKKGWSAEWRDAEGHWTRFRHAGHLSSLELGFDGEEAVTLVAAEGFDDLSQAMGNLNARPWLEGLGRDLAARYNLRLIPPREDDALTARFPDGLMLSLVLPVAADRLLDLFQLHLQLRNDPAIRVPIEAYVRLGFSVVNYIEGRNPAMLAHPAGLVLHHVNALGTPAADMPAREVDEEGVAAWTLQRSHYLYIAHFPLREARRLVARLAGAGLLGEAATGREGWPQAPEFAAALMPQGYELALRDVWWFDAERRRRVFYPRFAHEDDRATLVAGSGDLWMKAMIRDAVKAAEATRADTVRGFVEGLGSAGPEGVPAAVRVH